MLKLTKLLALVTVSVSLAGCFHTQPEEIEPIVKDPVVIVVADSSVPILVDVGTIIPWDCYFVINTDLLSMMDGNWVEYKAKMKKMDVCDAKGYILHPNIVQKRLSKIKLKK